MKLFGQIMATMIETTCLPLDLAKDAAMLMADAADGEKPGHRTAKRLKKIEEAAKETGE